MLYVTLLVINDYKKYRVLSREVQMNLFDVTKIWQRF